MRDLLTDPIWEEKDLGQPIPESPHACSVALPLWKHVIGYEEEDADILDRLQCGYPRFFCNRIVRKLFDRIEQERSLSNEKVLLFPSIKAAERCADYVRNRHASSPRIEALGHHRLSAVYLPNPAVATAMDYWRYSGEIVTSRQAEAALDNAAERAIEGDQARRTLRQRLAKLSGQNKEDVFLFPSGMSAVFAVHRAVQHIFPGWKSAQLEFPYVDVLRIQKEFGAGVHFFPLAGTAESQRIGDVLEEEQLSGVFCELASNPLLRSADVDTLLPIALKNEIPLVVDDTISSNVNIDAFRVADVVTSSLTKFFSGTSDVMAGSVILRHDSPFREPFASFLREEINDGLWDDDAIVLEHHSRDYVQRMQTINSNGEILFDYLSSKTELEHVFYPKSETPEFYRQLQRPNSGYGGLLSFVFKEFRNAPPFYDRIHVTKGPSLGTNFTLACPYTLLAHYRELDWAESCGCSRGLIRVSVGLEDPGDLIQRFEDAFLTLR